MVEASGYRQHGDSINALKHEYKHAPRQLPGKSNSIDSNQTEVIRDLQNQVTILTDLDQGKQDQPGCGAQSSRLTSSISGDFDENATKDKFLYITVFGDLRIAALVDTGSSINVISKSLYDSISDRHKLYFEQLSESEIRLANNDKIKINGISKLQATIHQKNEIIETYIIPKTSHPLILVEHKIHLKPNAVGKHHKPNRLPPYKREVLREQLDILLEQGIVVPDSELEELPITSPIVLVTKRNEASNTKTSTQSYRFVCDFRHLISQTEDFKYVIPNLQELTESFAEIGPNYITSIDLSSGFFRWAYPPNRQELPL
ncbi:unnamed protein product [Mytilus coruscus]|uniref:Peptidase A2 domain-containing protein n=1 Tax=Mytilus coruscus TaxID=42192 RepID=A0A6J8EQZ8_MYTCO|nr:unnamed protein product [Mytilus coruscus]